MLKALLRHSFPALIIMRIEHFPFKGGFTINDRNNQKDTYCYQMGKELFDPGIHAAYGLIKVAK